MDPNASPNICASSCVRTCDETCDGKIPKDGSEEVMVVIGARLAFFTNANSR